MIWFEKIEVVVKVVDLLLAALFITDFVLRVTGHGGSGAEHTGNHVSKGG